MRKPAADRFWEKVDKTPGQGPTGSCWLWTAGTAGKFMYGYFWDGERFTAAHIFAWRVMRGEIPIGMKVCHKCDTPRCCNVAHLFLGTQKENMEDASRKGRMYNGRKTHCKRGHEFTETNTLRVRNGRSCRRCSRLHWRRWKERKERLHGKEEKLRKEEVRT